MTDDKDEPTDKPSVDTSAGRVRWLVGYLRLCNDADEADLLEALLARAEKAEARVRELETELHRYSYS